VPVGSSFSVPRLSEFNRPEGSRSDESDNPGLSWASQLDEFTRSARPVIERYVANRIHNRDHREEVVSRVMAALVRSSDSFRGDCPPEAFAVAIAANAVRNYFERDLKRESRQISLETWCESFCLQRHDADVGPYHQVHLKEEVRGLLERMIQACTPTECAVIEMVYQGNSLEEAALLLDMKPATVRSHFMRGREKLLAHLLVNAPELLGGPEGVDSAIRKMEASGISLSNAESIAVRKREGAAPVIRRAMLKLAPYLGVLLVLAIEVSQ
jgi:RNA polymerase sigma-70 factor (ECF subfamily)